MTKLIHLFDPFIFNGLNEASVKQELPRNKTHLVPAKLTFDEWLKIINPRDKFHGSESYNWDLVDMNKDWNTTDVDDIGKVYFSKKLKGKTIDFHGKASESKYAKKGSDGEYIRTPDGDLIYYTKDELKVLGMELYNYQFTAVDPDNNMIVGIAQDEWGALLIVVAKEYRGFGIGEILGTLMREYVPNYDTGGVTHAGTENLKRVYRKMVNMAAERGDYSRWVRSGELPLKKAMEILSSARASSSKVKSGLKNLEKPSVFDNKPEDWLWVNQDDLIIIYNRKLIDLIDNDFGEFDSNDDYWHYELLDQFIIGGIYIGAGAVANSELNIWQFGGVNDKVKQAVFNAGLGQVQYEYPGSSVRVSKEIAKFIDPKKVDVLTSRNRNEVLVVPTGYESDYTALLPDFKAEKKLRSKVDKYGEIIMQIAEAATSKFDDYLEPGSR